MFGPAAWTATPSVTGSRAVTQDMVSGGGADGDAACGLADQQGGAPLGEPALGHRAQGVGHLGGQDLREAQVLRTPDGRLPPSHGHLGGDALTQPTGWDTRIDLSPALRSVEVGGPEHLRGGGRGPEVLELANPVDLPAPRRRTRVRP
jgi:hypothetical protein